MDLRNRGILFQFCAYEFINEAEKLFKQILMRNKKDDIYYRTQGQLVYHRQKMTSAIIFIPSLDYTGRQVIRSKLMKYMNQSLNGWKTGSIISKLKA